MTPAEETQSAAVSTPFGAHIQQKSSIFKLPQRKTVEKSFITQEISVSFIKREREQMDTVLPIEASLQMIRLKIKCHK